MLLHKLKTKFSTDSSGFIFGKLRKYRLILLSFFSTLASYIIFYLKGIRIGKNCSFYGIPILNRSFNSTIVIESGCNFRSDKSSNLVGLNRKCIISTFGEGTTINIGRNSGFSGTVIGAANSISIGNNVLSGANVLITDFDWHSIHPEKRHTGKGVKSAPVQIGNNVWLGINTIVLKGVSIGDNTVIGANSVVVKNIPPNVIAAGNPCVVLKSLEGIE